MSWELYLLSIVDGVTNSAARLAVASMLALFAAVFAYIAVRVDAVRYRRDEDGPMAATAVPLLLRTVKTVAVVGLTSGLVSALVPTTSALQRAYILREAPKVLNAENAEVAAKVFSDKVDALIKALGTKAGKQ